MCEMGIDVLAPIHVGLLLLATVPTSAGMEGCQYQQEIVIHENSGETLRDYQVLAELDGGKFPEEAQIDGAAIRFMDSVQCSQSSDN